MILLDFYGGVLLVLQCMEAAWYGRYICSHASVRLERYSRTSTSTVNDEQVMHVHNGRVAIILYILQISTLTSSHELS